MPTRTRSREQPPPKASRPFISGFKWPTKKEGLLPWKWAEDRLRRSHNYWLATTRPGGTPHVMVVWALWLDGILYFWTGRQTRKGRNLAHNPDCVICTDRADQAVIVEGTAREVVEPSVLQRVLKLYKRKYHWDPSALQQALFAVSPVTVFGFDEKKTLESSTRWKFSFSRPLRTGQGMTPRAAHH